jgi:hypothetical protein
MSVVLPYLPAGVEPAAMRMVAVCEALTESGDDFFSAPPDSMFSPTSSRRFRAAERRSPASRISWISVCT